MVRKWRLNRWNTLVFELSPPSISLEEKLFSSSLPSVWLLCELHTVLWLLGFSTVSVVESQSLLDPLRDQVTGQL